MKKITLILLLAFFQNAFCQQNLSFEDWTHNNSPSYDTPDGWWTTLNPVAQFTFPVTISVEKTTDSQNGDYALKATSKKWGTLFLPGMVAIGKLDLNINDIKPSAPYPFTGFIDGISGSYKYSPANGDSCVFYMNLTKWNGIKRDTIAEGTVYDKNASTAYQQFYLKLDYKQTGIMPDSIYFIAAASGGQLGKIGQVGSTLYVDNLSFNTNVKNDSKVEKLLVSIFPNPSNEFTNIKLPINTDFFRIELSDLNGKTILEKNIFGNETKLDLSQIQSGLYFIKIIDKMNNSQVQKIAINN